MVLPHFTSVITKVAHREALPWLVLTQACILWTALFICLEQGTMQCWVQVSHSYLMLLVFLLHQNLRHWSNMHSKSKLCKLGGITLPKEDSFASRRWLTSYSLEWRWTMMAALHGSGMFWCVGVWQLATHQAVEPPECCWRYFIPMTADWVYIFIVESTVYNAKIQKKKDLLKTNIISSSHGSAIDI